MDSITAELLSVLCVVADVSVGHNETEDLLLDTPLEAWEKEDGAWLTDKGILFDLGRVLLTNRAATNSSASFFDERFLGPRFGFVGGFSFVRSCGGLPAGARSGNPDTG